jgi:hypothetical protein
MFFQSRIVACLMVLLLLAPAARWFEAAAPEQACACAPSSCMCEGHEHASGHSPMCSMADGGRCGVRSADLAPTSFGDQPLPAPAGTRFDFTLALTDADFPANSASPLQGHSQPLERPPC